MKVFYLKDKKFKIIYKKWEKKKFLLNYHLSFISKNKNLKNFYSFYNNFIYKIPHKTSISKIKNRCRISYRGKSNYKKLRFSRIILKELIYKGSIIGYKPLTW